MTAHQPDLFPVGSGMHRAARSRWEVRDVHGYRQAREIPPGSRPGRWRFYVSGFNEHHCSVLRSDGTYDQDVPIDARNRIRLAGKWYGPRQWDH